MTIQPAKDDDIFARPPRFARRRVPTPTVAAPAVGRMACAVCGLRAEALICRECAEQPERSRALVRDWLHKNIVRANILFAEWDAAREPQQAAWDAIQAAREQSDYQARCARHTAAGNIYGRLLEAHERYEAALQPLDIERARLEKALEVLEGLL